MSLVRRRGAAQSIWSSRLVRALAGQSGIPGDSPTVMRCLDQYVPLTAREPQYGPVDRGADRSAVVLAWTGSGDLSYDEAERLVALDESTPWYQPVPAPLPRIGRMFARSRRLIR